MSQREKQYDYKSSETGAAAYDSEYYRTGCGPKPYEHNEYWKQFFGSIADALIEYLKPRTALTPGARWVFWWSRCGTGESRHGAPTCSEFAIQNVREDIRPYCEVGSNHPAHSPPRKPI